MINYLFYKMQRPEEGWDPIPAIYAESYADYVSHNIDINSVIKDLQDFVGDLKNKTVLDLGAGPGHFTVEFCKLGADTTWYDISHNYQTYFLKKNPELNVNTQIGYLEEVRGQYDVIFSRGCWCYARDEKIFAKCIVDLIKPGGCAYLLVPTEGHEQRGRANAGPNKLKNSLRRLQYHLNNLGLKIGHPFVSTPRLKKIFANLPLAFISFKIVDDMTLVKLQK